MTVMQAILQAWNLRSTEPAFTFISDGSPVTITFEAQLRRARAFAAELAARGVRPGDIVIVLMRHRRELADAFLGALWMGAIPSFMPPPSEKQDQDHFWISHTQLFRRIGARLLVTDVLDDGAAREWLGEAGCALWDLDACAPDFSREAAPFEANSGCTAFLQHSSGTTSQKKGVMLSHRAVLAQVESYCECLGLQKGEAIVSWLPLYHDMGLIACFMLPLLAGAHTVLMSPFEWIREPHLLLDVIDRYEGRFVWLPNFAFNLLAITRPPSRFWSLGKVKAFINCSEPCKADTFRLFAQSFADCGVRAAQLQVCYAMAETVFAVTQTPIGSQSMEFIADAEEFHRDGSIVAANGERPSVTFLSAGRPIRGAAVRILDENQKVRPEAMTGQIAVSGSSLFNGYHGATQDHGNRPSDGWHLTGDLGFTRDGNLFVTGRQRDLLIVRGRKYHGFDIEHIAGRVPGLKAGRCAAFAVENKMLGSEDAVLVAEVDPAAGQPVDASLMRAVKAAVYNELGLMLHDVLLVPPRWISKTTSGKISRQRNAEKYMKERCVHS